MSADPEETMPNVTGGPQAPRTRRPTSPTPPRPTPPRPTPPRPTPPRPTVPAAVPADPVEPPPAGPGGGVGEVAAGEVLAALRARGATVAVAESLTGGLLTAALTEPAGASAAVRGGLVVYATDLKASLAGVPLPLLDAHGPVGPDVAAALAAGARDRLEATYGLSVTGVAGPDPQGDAPVGTVFVGIAGPGGGEVRRLALSGDRAAIRAGTVRAALGLLADRLASDAGAAYTRAADARAAADPPDGRGG